MSITAVIDKGKNKRAVILTGANGGLGTHIADEYLNTGYDVIGIVRSEMPVRGSSAGGIFYPVVGDLRYEAVRNKTCAEAALRHVEQLIFCHGNYINSFLCTMTPIDIDIMLGDLTGTIQMVRALSPYLNRTKLIINVNSVAAHHSSLGESVYAAVKHGHTGFFKSLRYELKPSGVHVMEVFPGAMKTSMMINRPDLDNLMRPSEVAKLIKTAADASLASESAQINELYLGRKQ